MSVNHSSGHLIEANAFCCIMYYFWRLNAIQFGHIHCIFGGVIEVIFMSRVCHAFLSVHCNLVVICWDRANLLALLCVMFYCVLSLSRVVSCVMCNT